MMHMVPSCPSVSSATSSLLVSSSPASDSSSASSSSFDFDLDLLDSEIPGLELPLPESNSSSSNNNSGNFCSLSSPAYEGQQQQPLLYQSPQHQVPSPTNALSPIEATDGATIPHSPTMFSPADPSAAQKTAQMKQTAEAAQVAGGQTAASPSPASIHHHPHHHHHQQQQRAVVCASASVGGRYVPLASPVSLPPASPYSPPNSRGPQRLSSTDSARTCSSTTSTSSSTSSASAATAVNLQESLAEFQELQNRIKQERDATTTIQSPPPPPYPGSPKTTTKATVNIKIEPVDHQSPSSSFIQSPPSYSASACSSRQRSEEEVEAEEQAAASTSTVKMEPVFNLAMEHVKKDILAACKIMGISPSEYLKETLEHKGMRFLTVLIGKNCATF